ncbi:hypothetical protein [Spirillospora sp. CA-128828]|uniref:hypothetical protein n=1 Tax=Spirillospora sp. CA-128828 TaxID=3240033 RepID=UPI003D9114C8
MTEYTFLSWARSGAAASLADPDDLRRTAPVRGRLGASISVTGGAPLPVPMDLYGPADVRALDQRQIVRVYPLPGTPDAETTRFPLVEFDREDLPWMFTPLAPGAAGALRPWLALVCVPQDFRPVRETGRSLPVLRVPANELPDPATLHLWAHAQVLAGDPRGTVSRLLCPRRLSPHTSYVACVVPAFEAGRRAGLGEPGGGDLAPAWPQPGQAVLPVYFSWTFATGEGGDFETLATRLRPWPLPDSVGTRTLDVRRPGLFDGPGEITQRVESALRRPGAGPREPWPATPGSAAWRTRLAGVLAGPGDAGDPDAEGDEDPLVTPPLYGGFHRPPARVDPAATGWLDTLNLDPRWRVAAGLGTRSVQREQEGLMASAWTQLADIRAANRFVDLARLARLVSTRLHGRHVRTLSADEVLHLAAPLQARAPVGAGTLRGLVESSALPTALATVGFRRATRPHGSLSRRVAAAGALRRVPFASALTAVAGSAAGLKVARRDPDGTVALRPAPEQVVSGARLEAVRQVVGSYTWSDLAAQATLRAAAREVPTERLAAATDLQQSTLDSAFRLAEVPEIGVPAAYYRDARLLPDGGLRLPNGRVAASALAAFGAGPGPAAQGGAFTGAWTGPWDSTPAFDAGSWRGDSTGEFTRDGARTGAWRGRFEGTWDSVSGAGYDGTWKAVFAGDWECDGDRGEWRGLCTGTWEGAGITSDGVFTGSWRSREGRHGAWHGRCPGTWDWDASGTSGTWRTECAGGWELSEGAPQGEGGWTPEGIPGVLEGWRPERGIALDRVFDPGFLDRQSGRLPAPAVLDVTPPDAKQMAVEIHDLLVLPPDAPAVPARETFPAARAVDAVVELTDPARAIPTVVGSRVEGGEEAVQWAPTFPAPMWPPLAEQSTEWLLAGLEHVPPDTATLAVTNPAFVAAYLVGLNHEFARELRWREYPTDQRGTYFSAFWGEAPDIGPIHGWDRAPALGEQVAGPPARIVLVLRSALLRRYPGALIYAAPILDREPDDSRAVHYLFRGSLDPDTAFLGFDLTREQLLATPWCFVIAEQPSEPRFGIDDPPEQDPLWGRPYQAPPETVPPNLADDWNNLDWSHLFDGKEAFDAATHAPGTVRPNVGHGGLVWGAGGSSGAARQCFQQPVRVVLPAAKLLEEPA